MIPAATAATRMPTGIHGNAGARAAYVYDFSRISVAGVPFVYATRFT